ncbi:MAG: serine/threonine protein kinase [Deltaproteobacteria bacterium]|nr:serine/threonine protein kinase [Deltaproteobacteria bacterium]
MDVAPGAYVTSNIRLVEELGRGGMGSVWVADHLGLNTRVAVKFILAELDGAEDERLTRFRGEASVASQIKSPHVVQMFDHGVTDSGTPYIVMELLHGESLKERLQRDGPLDPEQTSKLVAQVAQVLAAAHQLGIVHRDIKPGNLFLVATAYDLFVKVLDFGIAKRTGPTAEGVTATGAFLGSPQFMSPETIGDARSADPRADLWSLAGVAYEAMLGRPAFAGESLGMVLSAVVAFRYTPPSQVAPPFAGFDGWFARAFHPEMGQRFQSASELADSFQAIASGQGTVGPPPAGHPVASYGTDGQATGPAAVVPAPVGAAVAGQSADWVDGPTELAPQVPSVPVGGQVPPRKRGWIWAVASLLAVGVAVVVTIVIVTEGPRKADKERSSSRDEDDDDSEARVETTATSAAPAGSGSARTVAARPPGVVGRPPPPPGKTTTTATATATATAKAKAPAAAGLEGKMASCWGICSECKYSGAGSSATAIVSFRPDGSVSGVNVTGPAAQFGTFKRCVMERGFQKSYPPSVRDAGTAISSVALPKCEFDSKSQRWHCGS